MLLKNDFIGNRGERMTVAGITLFNPEKDRLKENIEAVINQVDAVVCIDNGSNNIDEIENDLLKNYNKLSLVKNNKNVGIARALNQMFEFAKDNNYEYVLTLDQDSVVPENLMSEYLKYMTSLDKVGSLSPLILDRNYAEVDGYKGDIEVLDKCITSASLTSVKTWEEVGGFYEPLFIDLVDHDFCAKLVEHGYKIYRINTVHLMHEIGHGKTKNVFGKKFTVLNHSAFRKYYIVRNRIIYMYMHRNSIDLKEEKGKYYKFFIKTIVCEDKKIKKLSAMIRGVKDGKAFVKSLRQQEKGE